MENPSGELLPAGTVVGDYAVENLLGSGGFANVYRATHVHLGTCVAVKVLSRALALDHEAMRRFVIEAQSAIRIAHPNVVRVLGFGMLADGRAYQVMELVDGPTLEEHLAERRLGIDEALETLDGIAAALDAAHAAGIVHRDLKPANVLLARVDGRLVPRLADFGIAKALEADQDARVTRTGMTLGTPLYMSPEQALGRSIGPSSDVYSFGVVAFELLTGRMPYEDESPFATMMLHVQAEVPVPSVVEPALGVRFDEALRAMLAKRPENRPASLLEAMRALRSQPREARQVSATTDTAVTEQPFSRRAVILTAALLVAIGTVVAVLAIRDGADGSLSASPSATIAPPVAPVLPPTPRPDELMQGSAEVKLVGSGSAEAVRERDAATKRPAKAKPTERPSSTRVESSDSFEMPPDYKP